MSRNYHTYIYSVRFHIEKKTENARQDHFPFNMKCFRRLVLCQTFPKKNKHRLSLNWRKGGGVGGGMGQLQKGRLIRRNKEQKRSNNTGNVHRKKYI